MKFWKSLSWLIEETLPEWRDKFLSYKDLKKRLKLIYPCNNDASVDQEAPRANKRRRLDQTDGVAKEVIDFVSVLEDEIEKFNSFIEEKEEDFVIKWKELQERVRKAMNSNEELMRVGREIVDFHGEMVLLENYSALNYTGLVKILKKYDKRSGELLRVPFVQRIMQQPFFTTHVLNLLVKECETMLDHLFTTNEPSVSRETSNEPESCDPKTLIGIAEQQLRVPKELSEIENMESMYTKLTLSALRVLKEIRSGSSTVNMFSLPPLQINTLEEDWKKVPVLQQAAK